MRLGVVYLGIGLIVIGIVLSASLIGALFGIPLGFIGFTVLIAGLIMSDGTLKQPAQQTGFIPPQNQYQQVAIPVQNSQTAASKFCPYCRSRLQGSYEFCNVCGKKQEVANQNLSMQQQAESKFCAACGTKMPSSSVFCPSCGAKQG
jgi:hypothetical protein